MLSSVVQIIRENEWRGGRQGDTVSSRDVDGSFEMRGLCLEGWKSVGRWRGGRRDELAGTRVLFLSSGVWRVGGGGGRGGRQEGGWELSGGRRPRSALQPPSS